jgi:hypothetical protein
MSTTRAVRHHLQMSARVPIVLRTCSRIAIVFVDRTITFPEIRTNHYTIRNCTRRARAAGRLLDSLRPGRGTLPGLWHLLTARSFQGAKR